MRERIEKMLGSNQARNLLLVLSIPFLQGY